jgi:tetratricopeptide (TPR) repeat protein
MADDLRRWSDELAHDPASLAFLPLGEALRRQGQHEHALRVTLRGLERHPHLADAHDLLARICVDRGELERAFDEWDMTLRLAPEHAGALKGLAFVCYQQGRFPEAEAWLQRAAQGEAADVGIGAALETVRRSTGALHASDVAAAEAAYDPHDPRALFADSLDGDDQTAILLDPGGMVRGGLYLTESGRDVAPEIGAALSGVSDEASRATRHLGIGAWTSIVFETESAAVAMAPTVQDGLLVVAASRATPLGHLRRLLARCVARAAAWLGGTA